MRGGSTDRRLMKIEFLCDLSQHERLEVFRSMQKKSLKLNDALGDQDDRLFTLLQTVNKRLRCPQTLGDITSSLTHRLRGAAMSTARL